MTKPRSEDILILDIERLPGHAQVHARGLDISGDFWDLNSWKHTIGRRLHPDEVVAWPRTICAAWNFYGRAKIHFAAEWQPGHRHALLTKTWEAFDKGAGGGRPQHDRVRRQEAALRLG